jgi:hypothetical protein
MPPQGAKGSPKTSPCGDIRHIPVNDPASCLDLVEGRFQEKWGGADHQRNGLMDMLYNRESIVITQKEICTSIEDCKKANRLGHFGLCPFALGLAFCGRSVGVGEALRQDCE